MSKFDKFKIQIDRANSIANKSDYHFEMVANEYERVSDLYGNVETIITDIDRQFEQHTKLNSTDVTFLLLATVLQCAKWIIMPPLDLNFEQPRKDDRISASEGGNEEKKQAKKYIKENSDHVNCNGEFFSWEDIILKPVAYDAMHGSAEIQIKGFETKKLGKEVCGTNHHSATLGHDPILGWIFGSANIMSRKITFHDGQTFDVTEEQVILGPPNFSSIPEMFKVCYESYNEDDRRIFAAVARQAMHFQSDKYTKFGLQIPLINADLAQKLMEKGWNSAEAEKLLKKIGVDVGIISLQVGVSILINNIIRALHLLTYNEYNDGDIKLYEVKTRKILSYSNAIASASNVIFIAIGTSVGLATNDPIQIKRTLSKLDIGGISVTLYRLITDSKFIQDVKREFIENRWYEKIVGDEYNF